MASLEYVHDGRVARLTLDRPPLNVIDLGYAGELALALESARRQTGVTLLLLEARGKAFSAGVDVRDHLPDRGAEMLRAFHRVCRLLLESEVPVIAAVHGPALGGGCELTLACDVVVASSRATFGQPEIRLGVFPPLASVLLPRVIGPRLANDLLLTGRTLDAEEALRSGLVSRVVPEAEWTRGVEALVAELLASSPASLRLAKQALRVSGPPIDPRELDRAERLYIEELMNTPDAIEGLRAFMEKRPPAWTRPPSGGGQASGPARDTPGASD